MDKFKLEYKAFGKKAILIQWPRMVDESILNDIIRFNALITREMEHVETVPAYNSLTLIFNEDIELRKQISGLKSIYKKRYKGDALNRKVWHIPVCYEPEFGIDMEEFTLAKRMTAESIIELHTAPVYTIYAIGFLPGFMYLGGLNESLYHPRRSKPRMKIPLGSVGIGGEQTGVYPQESPGGWNIIGNSPVKIFNAENENPCGVSVGDKVKFYPIDIPTHQLFTIQVKSGIFHLKTYELDD